MTFSFSPARSQLPYFSLLQNMELLLVSGVCMFDGMFYCLNMTLAMPPGQLNFFVLFIKENKSNTMVPKPVFLTLSSI